MPGYRSSDRRRVYEVTLTAALRHCECAGFRFRGECRHLTAEAVRLGGPGATIEDAQGMLAGEALAGERME